MSPPPQCGTGQSVIECGSCRSPYCGTFTSCIPLSSLIQNRASIMPAELLAIARVSEGRSGALGVFFLLWHPMPTYK